MSQEIHIRLDISAEQYRRVYAGSARFVHAQSLDGRTVKFPAEVLRPHVTHDGIHGVFALQHDNNNRFIGIRRVAENQST